MTNHKPRRHPPMTSYVTHEELITRLDDLTYSHTPDGARRVNSIGAQVQLLADAQSQQTRRINSVSDLADKTARQVTTLIRMNGELAETIKLLTARVESLEARPAGTPASRPREEDPTTKAILTFFADNPGLLFPSIAVADNLPPEVNTKSIGNRLRTLAGHGKIEMIKREGRLAMFRAVPKLPTQAASPWPVGDPGFHPTPWSVDDAGREISRGDIDE